MSGEVWKEAPGWPEYLVSTEGNVFSKRSSRFIAPQIYNSGYSYVTFCRGNKPERFRLARLILLTFVGQPDEETMQAAHRDGTRSNDRLENLYWATPKENQADRIEHGTTLKGGAHPMAKLSDDDVSEARKLRADGMLWTDIAARFDVTADVVSSRVRRAYNIGRRKYA